MSISTVTASDRSNRRPHEAHHTLCSNTASISSSSKLNFTSYEESSDNMIDKHDEDESISSQVVFPSDALRSNPDGSGDEMRPDSPLEGSTSPLRVRFRPRVRIASGLNRHRHRWRTPATEEHQDYFTFTPSSSSGSPSSSISAPLHSLLDDEVGKPGWGTLGQRVALFSKRQYPSRQQPDGGLMAKGDVSMGTERTPLLNPSLHLILRHELRYLYRDRSDEEDFARLVDQVFGPWPTRLLNHHWWQWQLEPLMACQCFNSCDDGCP